jgi:hypothetical protein
MRETSPSLEGSRVDCCRKVRTPRVSLVNRATRIGSLLSALNQICRFGYVTVSVSVLLCAGCLISSGVYTVRGVTYLEGRKFEDKLRVDGNCEVFVEVGNWVF